MLGNLNFYQDGMGSAVDAFQKGQKHWSDLLTADVNRANTAANTTNTLERLGMDKEKHPLDLERMRTQNVGYGLDNDIKRGTIDKAEREKRQKSMEDFFKYMEQYDDVEGAIAYSGAPPKLGDVWRTMTPQQRAQMYDQFSKARTRDADRKAKEDHERALALEGERGRQQRLTGAQTAQNNRDLEQMRIDAGKYDKKSSFTVNLQNELARARGAAQKFAVVSQYLAIAQADPQLSGDMRYMTMLQKLRDELEPQARTELQQRQNPNALDINQLMNTPPPANRPLYPGQAGQPTTPQGVPPMPPGAVRPRNN